MPDLILTDEQRAIVALDVPKGQILKISAFAGTAKTTTLREFTKAHPNNSFLYLAYNKSVQSEAESTFPSNVECRTTHSLGYQAFGKPYAEKLYKCGPLKPFVLTDHLGVKHYGLGKYLIDVLIKYLASADEKINESHLILDREANEDEYFLEKDPDTIKYLLKKVNQLWEKMQDPENKKIPMIHDGYLKMYQLSKPQLNYDYILLDEAHDTNPVVLDLFLNQQHAAKIIVGDSHQSCYGFRWAYNALNQVDGDIHKYLSNSFRFNGEIAKVANLILNKIKKEKKQLIGVGKEGEIGKINENEPYAIVARTNAALFDEAASHLHDGKSYGFVGTSPKNNFDPYNHYYFNRIEDVFRLYVNDKKRIKDKYIKRFTNFNHFLSIIKDEDAPDIELQSRAAVVLKHKTNIPLLIDSIRFNAVDPKEAHIVFSTAHRSKGLEWPQVKLTNDFVELVKEKPHRIVTLKDVDDQEINLAYIACTRAKKILQINENILKLIEYEK